MSERRIVIEGTDKNQTVVKITIALFLRFQGFMYLLWMTSSIPSFLIRKDLARFKIYLPFDPHNPDKGLVHYAALLTYPSSVVAGIVLIVWAGKRLRWIVYSDIAVNFFYICSYSLINASLPPFGQINRLVVLRIFTLVFLLPTLTRNRRRESRPRGAPL